MAGSASRGTEGRQPPDAARTLHVTTERGRGVVVVASAPREADFGSSTDRKPYYTPEAGVPEYWIADPDGETVMVLRLDSGRYVDHGTFARGQRFESPTYAGLSVDVNEVFEGLDRVGGP